MKEIKLLIALLLIGFSSNAQIAPANDLLGKKYNKVYDKGILEDYNHKVFTDSNMVVTRVDVYVDLKNDYIDLVNHLLEHYKHNSDSIMYTKNIGMDFSFVDLEFIDGESIMTVYSDSYVYVFILDRKKITLQHYKNEK
jgi:hypothetical protein